MKLQKLAGATSEIWQIFIADSTSTTGAGLAGLTNASGGLTAYYHRDTDTTATVISLVSMTVGTFTSSGFKEIDSANMPGWYQFCPPNAALASGAKSCAFLLKGAASMVPLPMEAQLTAVNPDDAVAFGLSRIDAAVTTRMATFTLPANFSAMSISAGGLVDILQTAADKVWATTTRALTDKVGFALSAAGVQAIWDALTSALTTVGSIGKLLVTNIDAAISSRSTYAGGAVASVTGAVGSVTGNVGGNVAGSVGSVTGAVGSVTAAVTVGTNNDKTGYALSAAAVQAIWDALTTALTTVGSIGKRLADFITGDAYVRLGAPAGASVSADVAAVKADSAAIKLQTDQLGFASGNVNAKIVTTAVGAIDGPALAATAGEKIADAHLGRNVAGGSNTGRLVKEAIYRLRNRVFIAGGTMHVMDNADSVDSWTAAVTTTAGSPVSDVDPA